MATVPAPAPSPHCTNRSCRGTDMARHAWPWHRRCANAPRTGTDTARPPPGQGGITRVPRPHPWPEGTRWDRCCQGWGASPQTCAPPPSAGVSVGLLLHRPQPVLRDPQTGDPQSGTHKVGVPAGPPRARPLGGGLRHFAPRSNPALVFGAGGRHPLTQGTPGCHSPAVPPNPAARGLAGPPQHNPHGWGGVWGMGGAQPGPLCLWGGDVSGVGIFLLLNDP